MKPSTSSSSLADFRPPAVPLAVHTPYFSIWCMADHLYDDWTKHWTGSTQAMCGMVSVDGSVYRWAGGEFDLPAGAGSSSVPAAIQTNLEVNPTSSTFKFTAGPISLIVSFLNPLIAHDIDLLCRPITYVNFEIRSLDDNTHDVILYFDCTAECAVNSPEQIVNGEIIVENGLQIGRMGTTAQPVLEKSGDDIRIDWGHFYLSIPSSGFQSEMKILPANTARQGFALQRTIANLAAYSLPGAVNDGLPTLSATLSMGEIGQNSAFSYVMLSYDEIYSIELMGERLLPYWKRNNVTMESLLKTAEEEFKDIQESCSEFNHSLKEALRLEGGEEYAQLSALAYSQAIAAHGFAASKDGKLLLFPKENFSNGCISTVDVIYPSAPLFLCLNPDLLRGLIQPVLDYARSEKWKFSFAPHDLGTYPKANGQVYGGGEEDERDQMPVEESGNMLILMAALSRREGHAKYAEKHWSLLEMWAEYLIAHGLDPANQLCTDDFAGHLAHNCNLSIKAILAIGGFSILCSMTGRNELSLKYLNTARDMADQWVKMAFDGDHYRLAFNIPGSWSQKYNLVWDSLLGLNFFPPELAETEVEYYLAKQNQYGLPLDNRQAYTKLDWVVWSAALTKKRGYFEQFIAPLYRFVCETPDRIPLTDWFDTKDARKAGFQARSVVGGLFIKMLDPLLRDWKNEQYKEDHSPSV